MDQISGYPLDHLKVVEELDKRDNEVIKETIFAAVNFDPNNRDEPLADVTVTRTYRVSDTVAKDILKKAL
jgi:hypothetical protein